jgi:hypothetical protein
MDANGPALLARHEVRREEPRGHRGCRPRWPQRWGSIRGRRASDRHGILAGLRREAHRSPTDAGARKGRGRTAGGPRETPLGRKERAAEAGAPELGPAMELETRTFHPRDWGLEPATHLGEAAGRAPASESQPFRLKCAADGRSQELIIGSKLGRTSRRTKGRRVVSIAWSNIEARPAISVKTEPHRDGRMARPRTLEHCGISSISRRLARRPSSRTALDKAQNGAEAKDATQALILWPFRRQFCALINGPHLPRADAVDFAESFGLLHRGAPAAYRRAPPRDRGFASPQGEIALAEAFVPDALDGSPTRRSPNQEGCQGLRTPGFKLQVKPWFAGRESGLSRGPGHELHSPSLCHPAHDFALKVLFCQRRRVWPPDAHLNDREPSSAMQALHADRRARALARMIRAIPVARHTVSELRQARAGASRRGVRVVRRRREGPSTPAAS